MRTPFEEVIARAIEEGGRIHSRSTKMDGPSVEDSSSVVETIAFEFGSPAAAARALKIIREQLRRQYR